jgi:asparagine synthase (glutamine-hydrolysing)
MCGIGGTVGLADRKVVTAMNDAMSHRGPDDHGVYIDEKHSVALGHRRLSILDLSPTGHQPMSYRNGRYWAVFNGEIYNFAEIRDQLVSLGHSFISRSDTEVLLASYAQWGAACVSRLRGMFVFAIYDRGDDASAGPTLCLARDRLGIKPLYYSIRDGRMVFASEIKGLLASGMVSRRVDRQSIWEFLSLGSVPQPGTILAEAKALMPGHVMTVTLPLEIKITRYWDIADDSARSFPEAKSLAVEDARLKLRGLLDDAAKLHLLADVPVGAFLSGGIDSTAVVGLMIRATGQPIKTFAVGFESNAQHENELAWAKVAAKSFHSDHTEVVVTGAEVAGQYDDLVHAIDQPSLDGTNTYLVSRAAGRSVKVALSGLGGDELFAGYPHFREFSSAARWDSRLQWLGVRGKRAFLQAVPGRLLSKKQMLLAERGVRYATLRSLCSDEQKQAIAATGLMDGVSRTAAKDLYGQWLRPELGAVAETSYVELRGYLPNTLLRDVDAMAMANSLEVRPVLLDHVVAEFVFALPDSVKLGDGENKPALVAAVRDLLPEEIVRRKKTGFELPLTEWLAGPLRERALAAFSSPPARAIFSPEFLTQAMRQLSAQSRPPISLWAYLMLVEWLGAHSVEL